MFAMIGSDNAALAGAVRDQLLHAGLPCEPRHVVPLEQLVDRVGLESPSLVILDQPASAHQAAQILRELALVSNAHVISIGPAEDPKRIMAIMQSGAHEYLDATLWQSMLVESLTRFRTRSRSASPAPSTTTGKVIGVLSASGGAGGSTLALNIAAALAAKHRSSLLMDLRLDSGDLAAMLDLKPAYCLADLCENLGRLDESLFVQILNEHRSGVHLLAAPFDYHSIDRVTIKGFRRGLALGIRRYPYVVLDMGGVHGELQEESVMRADLLVMVLRLEYPSLRNAKRFLEHLETLGIPRERLECVVNRFGESRELSIAEAQEALGLPIVSSIPDEPSTVQWCLNHGEPVVLSRPRAKVSRKMSELVTRLEGKALPR